MKSGRMPACSQANMVPVRPKPDGDLIGDQVHAVAVAGLAQQLEVDRVVHAHAGRALHQRLDDHRRDLVGVPGEGCLHVRELCAAVLCPAHARARARSSPGSGTVMTSISSGW